jgi:hypothetical protein
VGLKKLMVDFFVFVCAYRHFQQYFSYIMATSFSGGRSWNTRREAPTTDKQLVNFITSSRVQLFCNFHDIAEILLKVAVKHQNH